MSFTSDTNELPPSPPMTPIASPPPAGNPPTPIASPPPVGNPPTPIASPPPAGYPPTPIAHYPYAGSGYPPDPAGYQPYQPPPQVELQGRRRRRFWYRSSDFAKGSVAFSFASGMAIYSALRARGYSPGLVAASLGAILTLSIGVLASTVWRRHRALAFINLIASFMPLIIGLANGGDFDPEVVRKILRTLDI